MFIGVMGAKGSGKDTVANILVERYGYTKVAFADPLRKLTEAVNPVVSWGISSGPIYYNDAIKEYGYTDAKEAFPELRRFLQRMGTEGGRECIHDDLWIDLFRDTVMDLGHDRVVASDCRFQNEVDFVRQMNGKVITVIREGVDPEDEHPSERYWREIMPDADIFNDGALVDLEQSVDDALKEVEDY